MDCRSATTSASKSSTTRRFRVTGAASALLGGRLRQTLFASGIASSYAAYGQGTVPIAAATELTLGLRYTIEHRSVEANGERLFGTAPFVRPIPGVPLLSEQPLRNSDTFRELTWRASLDRHFSDELMGYLVASRGFQSGGSISRRRKIRLSVRKGWTISKPG